jgi:ABC-2 type transport system ATP-binding protein
MNAIDVQNIVKTFGDFTAVKGSASPLTKGDLRAARPQRRRQVDVDPMMVTLLPPTAGTAVINGFDVVKQADGVRGVDRRDPQAMTSDSRAERRRGNLIIFAKL